MPNVFILMSRNSDVTVNTNLTNYNSIDLPNNETARAIGYSGGECYLVTKRSANSESVYVSKTGTYYRSLLPKRSESCFILGGRTGPNVMSFDAETFKVI